MHNCFHRVWMWCVVGGKCCLHLRQAVEGEEGMSLYLCDAVTPGNLTVTKRNGSTSVNRLTRNCKQITLEMSQIQPANMECYYKCYERHKCLLWIYFRTFFLLSLRNGTEMINTGIQTVREILKYHHQQFVLLGHYTHTHTHTLHFMLEKLQTYITDASGPRRLSEDV